MGEVSRRVEGLGQRMWSVCGGLRRNAGRRVIEPWTVYSESRLVSAVIDPVDAGGLKEAKVADTDDGLDIVFACEVIEGGETPADVSNGKDMGMGRINEEGLRVGLAGAGVGKEGNVGRGQGEAQVEHNGVW